MTEYKVNKKNHSIYLNIKYLGYKFIFLNLLYMKHYCIVLVSIITFSIYSQDDPTANAIENSIASLNIVDALSSRIPGAKKITDRMGNRNISIRGRQSFTTASDEVW